MPVINVNEDELDLALKLKKDGYTIKEIMEEMNIPVTSQSYNNFRTKIYRHNLKREKGIDYVDKKIEADTETIEDYYENLKRLEESAQLLDTKQTSVELNIPTEKPICIAFWGDWHLGSKGLDYKQFDSDRELIKNTDGLYFIGMGDYKDNNSSYVTRSTNENSICQSMQDLLVTSMMSEVSKKCIALVRGCFLAGTPILMSDGTYKNIEDIKEGDYVFSGTGKIQKVNKKFLNHYNGDIIDLKVLGNPYDIKGTADHKVMAIKRNEIIDCKGRVNKNKDYINNLKWYRLDQLEKGDYLVIPKTEMVKSNCINKNKAYLYGLFAAEGNFEKHKDEINGLDFTLSINEKDLALKVCEMFKNEWGKELTLKERPEKGQLSLRVFDRNIANSFYKHCGEYSYAKKFSNELLLSENSLLAISGLIDGDGHLKKQDNKVVIEITSKNLADQTRKILLNNNIPSVMDIFDRKDGIRKKTYRITIRNKYLDKINSINNKTILKEDIRSLQYTLDMEQYIAYPIKEYSTFEYCGETHDFEVDIDHSYLVAGFVAHNCHDDWDKKLGDRDFISELCRVTDSVNLWHGGMLNINIGKQTYNIFARHKYKNESGLNTTNAQRNMLNDVGPCDVAALGHKHFPDLQMLDRMNKKVVYLRSGSYKKYDEFGQKLAGYSGKTSVPCVILYPDTHKVLPFQELEDAIIHLNAIRK